MKFISILALAFLLGSCQTAVKEDAQAPAEPVVNENPADIESVKKLVADSFKEIWSDLDTARIRAYHTGDFILLEQGLVWNNDSIANYLLQDQLRMKEGQYVRLNRFNFIKSVQRQNTIWVAYQNYGTWVRGTDTVGTAQWLESAVAVREKDGWKLEQLHSTRMAN